jgi:leader peptidase (prepilin peptidase)/N-methyltransferase
MHWIIWVGSLAFGSIIGSFLNVCIYRIPKRESLVFPGSHCPHCGAVIRWYDNIPMISYVLLLGRCRACRARISWRYPLVEGLSALLCLLLALRYGLNPSFVIYYVLACALVVVTFIDLDHQIIPNVITYPGIPLGVLASFVLPEMGLWNALLGVLVGGGFLMLVALVFEWIRKKEGMGFGDVKLLAMIGAFLGWKGVVLSLVLSSAVGAVVGYAALRLAGKGSEHPIPYGPFLSLGALVYVLGGKGWLDWYLGLGVG